jgi:hypothetical protein
LKANNEGSFDRLTIGQFVGTLLLIVAVETRAVPRPAVFLLGPFVIWLCLLLVSPPAMRRNRWRKSLLIAVICSIFLYLVGPYISR